MDALQKFAQIVGSDHVLTSAEQTAAYCADERRLFRGVAAAVVRPGSRAELAAIVATAYQSGTALVPHGGNTGYCGGATPDACGHQVVVSLERLDRIISVDRISATLTVEAGVVLADAQAIASAHDLLLPLSMGSENSCQIGGNLSTNAGGLAVLRYGTARDLLLGLEVVLPNGEVISELTGLRKDTTGYDLKQLFVGAEGSLGIISAATLKLFPKPRAYQTVFAAVGDVAAACRLLGEIRRTVGDNVTSFEYIAAEAMALVHAQFPASERPFACVHEHYVLFEWAEFGNATILLEDILAAIVQDDLVIDAVIAQSEVQRRSLWRLRESIPAAERARGGSIKHDVSVLLGDVGKYVEETSVALRRRWPTAGLSVFGHIGDGNVHFNVLPPADTKLDTYTRDHGAAISALVHDNAVALGGSFSAEHGIGVLKRDLLARYATAAELELMRAIKGVLDPANLMNPGKVL